MFTLLPSEFSANAANVVTEGGRQYYVVPTTSIVPGVLPGSKGPGLYEPADIAQDFKQWDGMPAVVYHPSSMGTNVSAQHRGILKRSWVGFLRNTRLRADGALQHELWIDAKRASKVDTRVIEAVKNGSKMEVSTGLYTDSSPVTGNHGGKAYTWKATNFIADHLAILPDQRGACSIEDGCGLNVNEWSEEAREAAAMSQQQHAAMAKKHLKASLMSSAEGKDAVAQAHAAISEAHAKAAQVANANPNHDDKGRFSDGSSQQANASAKQAAKSSAGHLFKGFRSNENDASQVAAKASKAASKTNSVAAHIKAAKANMDAADAHEKAGSRWKSSSADAASSEYAHHQAVTSMHRSAAAAHYKAATAAGAVKNANPNRDAKGRFAVGSFGVEAGANFKVSAGDTVGSKVITFDKPISANHPAMAKIGAKPNMVGVLGTAHEFIVPGKSKTPGMISSFAGTMARAASGFADKLADLYTGSKGTKKFKIVGKPLAAFDKIKIASKEASVVD